MNNKSHRPSLGKTPRPIVRNRKAQWSHGLPLTLPAQFDPPNCISFACCSSCSLLLFSLRRSPCAASGTAAAAAASLSDFAFPSSPSSSSSSSSAPPSNWSSPTDATTAVERGEIVMKHSMDPEVHGESREGKSAEPAAAASNAVADLRAVQAAAGRLASPAPAVTTRLTRLHASKSIA